MLYIFYIKNYINHSIITSSIEEIFEIKREEICEFDHYRDSCLVGFDISKLDESSDFTFELNICCYSFDLILDKGFYNNLILGVSLSSRLNQEILINDESDDPYQWILINSNELFLVHSEDNHKEGISLSQGQKYPLSFSRALELLPYRKYVTNLRDNKVNPESYYVKNSFLWKDL